MKIDKLLMNVSESLRASTLAEMKFGINVNIMSIVYVIKYKCDIKYRQFSL